MLPVPAARQRVVLAALAVRARQVVSFEDLAGAIWDDAPPSKARVAVRNYVSRLRQELGLVGGQIVTRAPGYVLDAAEDDVDLLAFTRLCAHGGAAARAGAWQRAWDALSDAQGLWRGMPLADIPSRALHDEHVPVMDALRLQAIGWRAEAGLQLGRHAELVPELEALARAHQFRERFRAQLMLALYRCGRQGDALAAYRSTRAALVQDLGVEPGPDLQNLHQQILAADPQLLHQVPPASAGRPAIPVNGPARAPEAGPAVPRQLPADLRHFAGRRAELNALTQSLAQAGQPGGTVVISAVDGTAGVGKTTLAVHWAHQVAARFPDGQLYVNLRGFGPSGRPAAAAEVLRDLLEALGTPPGIIPAGAEARAALYRTLAAGRRLLIVLDNARDAAQVRLLLPAAPGCLVLVTSRSRLTGLVAADGAQRLTLGLLTQNEARQLLALRLGAARLRAEPDAAAELIGLCARLPLALAIASASPRGPLSALAAELRDARARLDVLDTGDPATCVRTVFSWSYQQLSLPAARMFRLLGLHPGPDITIPAAASLAAVSLSQARQHLGELGCAHLITEPSPGRYAQHDLLRAYATEQATGQEAETERHQAVQRALDYYLHTARAAALLLDPAREPVTLGPPRPGVTPGRPTDSQQALAWFEAEHHVLTSAVTLAARMRFDGCAWQLAWAVDDFLNWRGHWQEWAATQRTALAAATRLGDTAGQATARRLLAHTFARVGDYLKARSHLTCSLGLYRQLGDAIGEGRVHQTLGWVAERQGRNADALGHAEQALTLYQAAGDQARQAAALNNLGWCHALVGAYPQAQAFCRQALALHRQLGHRRGEANSWDSLGYAEHKLGNLAEAGHCHRQALRLVRELGDRYDEAEMLTHLGDVRHTAGDLPAAQSAWQQAVDILDELHHPDAALVRGKLRQASLPAKPAPAPA
jgi:DNA-binding SARP family transcriptional activator/Tfp pilus assembly protein PilF